ncbi:hypothetical protein EG831_03950, partial [bacterium]|nr:hypothetical protein [bacterium]
MKQTTTASCILTLLALIAAGCSQHRSPTAAAPSPQGGEQSQAPYKVEVAAPDAAADLPIKWSQPTHMQ